MKKFQKAILTVLVLIYAGITITITLPESPDNPSDTNTAQTYQAPGGTPFGPFDEGAGDLH